MGRFAGRPCRPRPPGNPSPSRADLVRKSTLSGANGQASFPDKIGGRRVTPLGADRLLDGCLRTLRALGKPVSAELTSSFGEHASSRRKRRSLHLKLGVKAAPLSFEIRTTRTHLSDPLATAIIAEAKRVQGPWLLCAPHVPGSIAHRLASEGVSYVDSAGNCHIEADGLLLVHVEGKPRPRETRPRLAGLKSHQLLFALLAQPALVHAPVRKVALAAGIGKSAALELLGQMRAQGLLDGNPGGVLHARRMLLDRWLSAYAELVRPSWLLTRCQPTAVDPPALEALIERACENCAWALGGTAAASRMLATDRGAETVLHLAEAPSDLLERLRAVPAPNGSLTILRTPGTLAYQGAKPHLAHPLLVYSELLTAAKPETRDAASALHQQFLAERAPTIEAAP